MIIDANGVSFDGDSVPRVWTRLQGRSVSVGTAWTDLRASLGSYDFIAVLTRVDSGGNQHYNISSIRRFLIPSSGENILIWVDPNTNLRVNNRSGAFYGKAAGRTITLYGIWGVSL